MSNLNLTSFAEALNFEVKGTSAASTAAGDGRQIVDLTLTILEGFPNHENSFPLYTGQELQDMVDSIARHGVQTPILVWLTEGGKYIIISGHNRVNASRIVGCTTVPAIIRTDLTMNTAAEMFFELNFHQRSVKDMPLSQQILCISEYYNLLKRQGKRTDLISAVEQAINPHDNGVSGTSSEGQTKLRTDEKIAGEYKLSRDKIAKFCRLSTLYRPLLLLLDDQETLGILAGYQITFIEASDLQTVIYTCITDENFNLTTAKAELLRSYYEQGKLTEQSIREVLEGVKKQPPRGGLPAATVKPKVLSRFFEPNTPKKVINDTIVLALEL